jgi:hypothetical protein
MSNQVTIKPDTNKVELTDQRRQILVTDNRTGTTVSVTQTIPEIIIVSGRGPAGISGDAGPTGSQGPTGSTGPPGTVTSNTGASISGSLIVSGSGAIADFTNTTEVIVGDLLTISGSIFVNGTLDAATKNFKIDHPTMEGYYLVHSSLEGPERGIYYRGKLKTSDTIHLPDYWKDLPVDETDISVQLTAIGNACQHFVKSVSKETIEVGCDCGKPHCYFIVHAQRFNEGRLDILEPKVRNKL